MITRPNTGTSGYEMDLQELREKYDRVSDNEDATATVQLAWTQVSFWRIVVIVYADACFAPERKTVKDSEKNQEYTAVKQAKLGIALFPVPIQISWKSATLVVSSGECFTK